MWIDPANSDHVLLGTDGGIYTSYNRTDAWDHINNFALGEFYRVTVDMDRPYHIAGGLQDNFSWLGSSQTRSRDGITNADWKSLGGGDGMYCAIDPTNSSIVYSESQNGTLTRTNIKTGERKYLQPQAKEGQPAFVSIGRRRSGFHILIRQRFTSAAIIFQTHEARRRMGKHQSRSDDAGRRENLNDGFGRRGLRYDLHFVGIARDARTDLGGHG
jgi:hypothetical protein